MLRALRALALGYDCRALRALAALRPSYTIVLGNNVLNLSAFKQLVFDPHIAERVADLLHQLPEAVAQGCKNLGALWGGRKIVELAQVVLHIVEFIFRRAVPDIFPAACTYHALAIEAELVAVVHAKHFLTLLEVLATQGW